LESINRSVLSEKLTGTEDLPTLSSVAVEILRLTRDESSELDEFVDVIGYDPALAAKLVRLANSAQFGPKQEISTVHGAVMMLGIKSVKLMSLSFSLADGIRGLRADGVLDLQDYWRRSLVSAASARALMSRVGNPAHEEAFFCGLVTHIGKLAITQILPEEYAEVSDQGRKWPTLLDEQTQLGFHSADVAEVLMKKWQMPDAIVTTVCFTDRPEELPEGMGEQFERFLDLMSLNRLFESVICDDDKGLAMMKCRAVARRHGLSAGDVDDFLIRLEPVVREASKMLDFELPPGIDHEKIVKIARRQVSRIGMGAATDLRQAKDRAAEAEESAAPAAEQDGTDGLTGLPARKSFDEALERQIGARLDRDVPGKLGLILVDLDRLQDVNDEHGREAGDEVLRTVASVLDRASRKGDLKFRYDGGRFAVILPGISPLSIRGLAERIRTTIAEEQVSVGEASLSATASVGAAWLQQVRGVEDAQMLVKLADHQLRKAKQNGRNRCEIPAGPPPDPHAPDEPGSAR